MIEIADPQSVALSVAAEYNADLYLYSGIIDDNGYGKVAYAISQEKNRNNALLVLTTNGGQANSAYQIARLFQKTYKKFIVFPPSSCKSAGTLIVLGAHNLIMDQFSELGPLDVQLFKQNEIMTRKSGLLSKSSFESLAEVSFELYEHFMLKITLSSSGLVSFKLASELSANMAAKLLAPVYAQINPDVIGSDYRDLSVALHYGIRLADHCDNADISTVMNLVNNYPSHDFIIDNEEASSLFKSIDFPSQNLYKLMGIIGEIAYNEQKDALVCPNNTDVSTGGPRQCGRQRWHRAKQKGGQSGKQGKGGW